LAIVGKKIAKGPAGTGSPFKVAHLTTVHAAGDVRIFRKECRSLAEGGYEVILIAPGQGTRVEEGVKIRGVPLDPARRVKRMTVGLGKILAAALREGADLYHFHDPELIPVGIFLKIRGKKVIYDVHEDYGASILEADRDWLPDFWRRLFARGVRLAERVGMTFFDAAVAATPAIGDLFPAAKVAVARNYPLAGELSATGSVPYQRRPYHVVYAGGISESRGIREMIGAMALMRGRPEATLLLAGEFSPPELEGEVLSGADMTGVRYLGLLSREELAAVLGNSRAGLVLFHPLKNHVAAQPNKLFEYMSAGIPVIASDFPLWREIVVKNGAGLLVDPKDVRAIAEAIGWLFDHPEEARRMGENGKEAVEKTYNWSKEEETLLGLYGDLLQA